MTFISVIDIFNQFKGNTGLRRSKIRDFDNKEKYLDTYYEQKQRLRYGKIENKVISDEQKQAVISKIRKVSFKEKKITLIKTVIAFFISLALIILIFLLLFKK
jgi:hypothetical protein